MTELDLSYKLAELYEFLTLEDGWDEEGAANKINYESVRLADAIARVLYYKCGILPENFGPLDCGGVSARYVFGENSFDIFIGLDGSTSIGFRYKDNDVIHAYKDVSLSFFMVWFECTVIEGKSKNGL